MRKVMFLFPAAVLVAAAPALAQTPMVEFTGIIGDAQYSNQFEFVGGLSFRF